MAWVEFYLTTNGNNLNAGSTEDNAALVTVTNKDWDNATGSRFTGSNGDFTGVTVGMWASIYLDAATSAVFVAQITGIDAVNASYIDVSKTANKIGTAPAAGATGRSCKVGGAWGKTGAAAASLAVVNSLFTNTKSTDFSMRINVKAGTYANSTTTTNFRAAGTQAAYIWWRGYTSSIGDLDTTTSRGTPYDGNTLPLWTWTTAQWYTDSGLHQLFSNIDLTSAYTAGASGTVYNDQAGASVRFFRCRIKNTAANANSRASTAAILIGCRLEATTTATYVVSSGFMYGCHVIGGVNSGTITVAINCIFESFATSGIVCASATANSYYANCTIDKGTQTPTNGISITALTTGQVSVTNCIIGNCTNGINNSVGTNVTVFQLRNHFYNCTNNLVNITECATYDSTLGVAELLLADTTPDPWVASASSNYTLASGNTVDKSAGWPGVFEGQTAMVGYPDIGAVVAVKPFKMLGTFGLGTISKESGANARGGSGNAIKFDPSSTTINLTYSFLVPCTAATEFTLNFYHMISNAFNGSAKVTIYDSDDDVTVLLNAESVSFTDDAAYHQYTSTAVTPTDTGFCRCKIDVLDGASTGNVFVDDITVTET